jgi:hypothetical protein
MRSSLIRVHHRVLVKEVRNSKNLDCDSLSASLWLASGSIERRLASVRVPFSGGVGETREPVAEYLWSAPEKHSDLLDSHNSTGRFVRLSRRLGSLPSHFTDSVCRGESGPMFFDPDSSP